MNAISKWLTALAWLSGAAYAQQPPDVVNSDGYFNTAMGTKALFSLTPSSCPRSGPFLGCYNTASGYEAIFSNTTGNWNTASGVQALYSNMTGDLNTASGVLALYFNTTGKDNTASGTLALYSNTTGSWNTASGVQALYSNTAGDWNTASGVAALVSNTTGYANTASGLAALFSNTAGSNNTASGVQVLAFNTTGSNNTASGYNALYSNTTGSNNIALGYQTGYKLTTGSYNIDIGNPGTAGDHKTIRIGAQGTQTAAHIAGIYNVPLTGNAVVVTSTGQLGVAAVSSERFKTAIAPMGSNTAKLGQLHPVTFKLKSDTKGTVQYGLIAEEVAKVYPELVIRDEKGRIDGVRYDELAPLLLNEMQQQAAKIRGLEQQVAQLNDLTQEMRAALVKLQSKDQLVAQR